MAERDQKQSPALKVVTKEHVSPIEADKKRAVDSPPEGNTQTRVSAPSAKEQAQQQVQPPDEHHTQPMISPQSGSFNRVVIVSEPPPPAQRTASRSVIRKESGPPSSSANRRAPALSIPGVKQPERPVKTTPEPETLSPEVQGPMVSSLFPHSEQARGASQQLTQTHSPFSYSFSAVNVPATSFAVEPERTKKLEQLSPEPRMLEEPRRIIEHQLNLSGIQPSLILCRDPGTLAAEQYRVLALKLRENKKLRVIGVTAPTDEEQGAVAAGNLALALAEGGRAKVMLLEASLRKPEIEGLFNLPFIAPGVGEQLRYHHQDPEAKWEVWNLSPNLSLLTNNQVEGHPAALLNLGAMTDLMSELRHVYNFTIVSLPPLMTSADAKIIQDYIDGILLVVRSGVTRSQLVKESIARLGRDKFCGAVLLDVPPEKNLSFA